MTAIFRRPAAWAVVLAGLACGCAAEPATGTVVGRVTLNGKPLDDGVVTLVPKAGGEPTTAAIQAGAYRAERVPVGDVLVTVAVPPPAASDEVIKKRAADGAPPPPPEPKSRVPERYADPGTSGLGTAVAADRETTYDIALSSK